MSLRKADNAWKNYFQETSLNSWKSFKNGIETNSQDVTWYIIGRQFLKPFASEASTAQKIVISPWKLLNPFKWVVGITKALCLTSLKLADTLLTPRIQIPGKKEKQIGMTSSTAARVVKYILYTPLLAATSILNIPATIENMPPVAKRLGKNKEDVEIEMQSMTRSNSEPKQVQTSRVKANSSSNNKKPSKPRRLLSYLFTSSNSSTKKSETKPLTKKVAEEVPGNKLRH